MRILAILLFLLPMVLLAQNYRGMSEEDMQKMMQQMQAAQSCMENVDQSRMRELEQRSRTMEAEVKSLCAEGKRSEAQKMAISYGKEIAEDRTVQELRKCGDMMKGSMPKMPYMNQPQERDSSQHICD